MPHQRALRAGRILTYIIVLFVLIASEQRAWAQERAAYGLFGDFSENYHVADFQHLPGFPDCCPRYDQGSGQAPAFGLFFRTPLSDAFGIRLGAGYFGLSGTLTETEQDTVLHNGVPTQGAFEHRLAATLSLAALEGAFEWNPARALRVGAGFRVGTLLAKSFTGQETIVQPDGAGTFLDSLGKDSHSRTRNNISGDIPQAMSIQLAALARVSYSLPMNHAKTLSLEPEVTASYSLTPVASNLKWHINSVRVGAGIAYSPEPAPARREERRNIDTIRIEHKGPLASRVTLGTEQHTETVEEQDDGIRIAIDNIRRTDTLLLSKPLPLRTSITAFGVDADGREMPAVKIRVEEFSSTLMTPLLNYVFFDENSSSIPDRYARENASSVDTFRIDRLPPNTLGIYHHLMDIVARRLVEHPTATLTVTGCNEDVRQERGNLALSRDRAASVARYLTDVWHIDPKRISMEARNLPQKHANRDSTDGAEENRRVEITSSDPSILYPVVLNDTLRVSNPPVVRFKPVVEAEAGLANWEVQSTEGGTTLSSFHGGHTLPASLDWQLTENATPRSLESISYSLRARDSDMTTDVASKTIPVEHLTIQKKREERQGDTVIDRFSLILFDVGSSALTEQNAPLIDLINSHVSPKSRVVVTGYTDRLGNALANQRLAERRARSVAEAMGAKGAQISAVAQADLYDSSLPEGRLYTRTVNVVSLTPVK